MYGPETTALDTTTMRQALSGASSPVALSESDEVQEAYKSSIEILSRSDNGCVVAKLAVKSLGASRV